MHVPGSERGGWGFVRGPHPFFLEQNNVNKNKGSSIMVEKDRTRYWSPSRTYEFELRIGTRDLTPDLYKVSIVTGIDFPYQTFQLELFLDPSDVILEKIYGQQEITLMAMLYGTSPGIADDLIEFKLMYLTGDLQLQAQNTMQTEVDVSRVPISFTAVPRDSFKIMSNYVNEVYENASIAYVVEDIVSKSGGLVKYDTTGKNLEVLDQVIVPPTTLYQALKHLNRTFGIFDGWLGLWCSYDKKLYLKNLTNKMKSSHLFTVYQFATNVSNEEIFTSMDEKSYYTKYDVKSSYSGNSKFAVFAPTMKHIVKPKDKLSHTIELDLEDFSKQYGLISKKNKIFFDNLAISATNRQRIYKDHTGYESSQSFINANMAEEIGDLSEITIQLERFLKLGSLMNVGEGIMFVSKVDDYKDLTGKYILRGSQLDFMKAKDWESSATLRLMRTNRIISEG
jgi:hypothetical protein